MTEQRNVMGELFARCWQDEDFKKRFLADPKSVLAEHGVNVPDHLTNITVVEDTHDTVNITLPKKPVELVDLSDAEMASMAGGSGGWGWDCKGDYGHS